MADIKRNATFATAVLAIAATATLLYNWSKSDENGNRKRLLDAIPVPKGGYPYIGHLLSFNNLPPGFKFKEWHDELGPVIRIQMGTVPWICIGDPEIAYQLLVVNGSVASNRANHGFTAVYNALGKRGIMISDRNRNWKSLRAALLSITSPRSVNESNSVLESEVDQLVDELVSASTIHDGIDPLLSFKRSSLNFVLETCFGTRVYSEKDPLFGELMTMLDEFTELSAFHKDISNFLPFLSFINILKRTRKVYEKYDRELRTPVIRRLIIEHATNSKKDCMFRRLSMEKEVLGLEDDDLLVAASKCKLGEYQQHFFY